MRPVRSIAIALLAFLPLTINASGDDVAAPSAVSGVVEFTIVESVETHGPLESIARICGTDRNIRGCTDFPLETLNCDCERRSDHWVINARAEVSAVIHLSGHFSEGRILAHERLHLEDLRAGLLEHLQTIASRPYQSESACATYAKVLTESPHLRVVMNRLRVKSNAKYRCNRHTVF